MLPAALLLAVAVWARVTEYGLTPDRFALICLAAWALVQSSWFLLRPKRRDIRIPTAIAAGFAVLAAFLAEPVSVWSQYARLRTAAGGESVAARQQSVGAVRWLLDNRARDWAVKVYPDLPDRRRVRVVFTDLSVHESGPDELSARGTFQVLVE